MKNKDKQTKLEQQEILVRSLTNTLVHSILLKTKMFPNDQELGCEIRKVVESYNSLIK